MRGDKFYNHVWLSELMIKQTLALSLTRSQSPSLANETGALSLD